MDPTILKHSSENIKVFVRCRPFFTSELSQSSFQSVSLSPASCEISLISPNLNKPGNKIFSFDGVFDYTSDQEQIYELCAFSLVESVFEGYNATIFAYGQTGSGKTYSMMGMDDSESLKGIIPRSFEHIMKLISSCSENKNFMITASFLEIYNEDIHDLLIKPGSKCELRETPDKGFFVKDLTQTVVNSVAELLRLLAMGNKHRVIGETKMNDKSSRSHTIFNIRVESSLDLDPNVKPKISVGKMNLVDLAGSERQNKTQSTDQRFKEAVKINLSLSALGNVISALADGKFAHIPYRDSKLTKLLQDSLGGNSKTIMLANINPNPANYEETLGTLRYASRTKMIKNKPKMNEDPKDALIRNYLDEINKLKSMLEDKSLGGAFTEGIFSDEILKKIKEEGEEAMKEKQKALGDLQDKEKELEEKGKMIGELIEKEGVYEKIRLDKEKLEQLLLEKERNLLQGNHAHEDNSKLEAMRKRIK